MSDTQHSRAHTCTSHGEESPRYEDGAARAPLPGRKRTARNSAGRVGRFAPMGRNAIAVALAALFSSTTAHAQMPGSEEMIDRFDKNGDGALSVSELEDAVEWMQRKREKQLAIEDILMRQWDSDDNNKLSRRELEAGMDSLNSSGQSASKRESSRSRSSASSSSRSSTSRENESAGSGGKGPSSARDSSGSASGKRSSGTASTPQSASSMDRGRAPDGDDSTDSRETNRNRATTATAAQSAQPGDRSKANARDKSSSQSMTGQRQESSDRQASSQKQSESDMSEEEVKQLEGKAIYTTQGVEIGNVGKIVADRTTGAPYVVVDRNMYFTAGDEQFALAVSELDRKNGILTATDVSVNADMEQRSYDASAFEAYDDSDESQQVRRRATQQQTSDSENADDNAMGRSSGPDNRDERTESAEKKANAVASSTSNQKDRVASRSAADTNFDASGSTADRSAMRESERDQAQRRRDREHSSSQRGYGQQTENPRMRSQHEGDDASSETQNQTMDVITLVFAAPEELIGMTVIDEEGRTIGEVEDVVLKKGSEDLNFFLVTSSDAFFGLGNDDAVVSIEEVRREGGQLVLSSVKQTSIFVPEDYLRVETVEN